VRRTLDLTVTVLAAQGLPLPPDDQSAKGFKPYVKVELHVEAPDEHHGPDAAAAEPDRDHEGEYKARTKTRKGRDVDFHGEALRFPAIPRVVEELTFVRFTVRDDEFGRDDLAAWACVRLDRLRTGYRFVHLMDCKGMLTEGVVLVKVEKKLA
jgi:phosphatidylinositol phospholipase C, delta